MGLLYPWGTSLFFIKLSCFLNNGVHLNHVSFNCMQNCCCCCCCYYYNIRYVSRLSAKYALNIFASPDTTGSYLNSILGNFDLLLFCQETPQLSSDFLRISWFFNVCFGCFLCLIANITKLFSPVWPLEFQL